MSLLSQAVRVRFAPSPTGFLHLGALRTALFNYLFAKQNKGAFILRIEDTDKTREVPGSAKHIQETLLWAGLKYDEGPDIGGEYGPYTQSERTDIYKHHAEILIQKGHAYRCFCTPERLDSMREEQKRGGLATLYDKFCHRLPEVEVQKNLSDKVPYTVRLNVNQSETTVVKDVVFGETKVLNSFVDDQILLKSDGYPTYHLANVVDDHLMKITHVIRGEEWLPSTSKHIMLYKAFGWEPPSFVHIPLLLNSDGSKLSKRQGDVSVISYREKGFMPQAMINFVAFLGWTPRDDSQILSSSELLKQFSLDRIHKAGAIVDFQKLKWINSQYLRMALENNPKDYAIRLQKSFIEKYTQDYCKNLLEVEKLAEILSILKDRAALESEFIELSSHILNRPDFSEQNVKSLYSKIWNKDTDQIVSLFMAELVKLPNETFNQPAISAIIQKIGKETKASKKQILPPLRLLLTGVEAGPSLVDIIHILGKEESLHRLHTKKPDQ